MTNKDNRNLIIGIIAVVVILALLGSFGGYRMMGSYNPGFMLFGGLFSILIIVLVIIGVYWLIKNVNLDRVKK